MKLNKTVAAQARKAAEENKATPRGPMPEGTYELRVADIKNGTSSTGNAMWVWEFRVTAAEGQEDYKNRKLTERTALTESALWKLANIFEGLGVPLETDSDDLIGLKLMAYVGTEEGRGEKNAGKVFNNIEYFVTPEAKPAQADEKPDAVKAATRTRPSRAKKATEEPPF